jgi:hypothetical protein
VSACEVDQQVRSVLGEATEDLTVLDILPPSLPFDIWTPSLLFQQSNESSQGAG